MGQPIPAPDAPEFRARAVELVPSSELSTAHVARDLGLTPETLRRWVKQAEIAAGRRDGRTTDEQAELARLRPEVAVLEEEREILTTAAAVVARSRAPVGCSAGRAPAPMRGAGGRPRLGPRPMSA